MRDSNILKLSDETEIDLEEETSFGTSSFVERVQYSKISQDLDQVWVLIFNKIERQIMGHFVNTMAEFKVRWKLDDDELEIMVNEFKDEVHRRIQASMDKELKKIKSRAGTTLRPPKEAMSRESTAQNKQRQRRLKIMQIKSIDMSLQKCDEDDAVAGIEFSDQCSEDRNCPCDISIKKKMIPKAVDMVNVVKSAPVKMDFDLRNILKRNPEYNTETMERNKRKDEMYVADFLNKENTSVEAEVEIDEGYRYISEKLDVSEEDSMEVQMTEGHAIREDGGNCAEETTEKTENSETDQGAEDEAEDVSDAEQDAKSEGDTVTERQDADDDGVAMQETEETSFHVTRNMVYGDGEEADVL
ncbi:retinitis pigmentosa 1-like 1 protein [Paramormyrops kingsleyae]|uniref:retinitis pigmentosa 1-like 1 protein n=1 Tax=Paramormyrops kingsleyae TaxID=1676925 RepID=UPI003B9764C3